MIQASAIPISGVSQLAGAVQSAQRSPFAVKERPRTEEPAQVQYEPVVDKAKPAVDLEESQGTDMEVLAEAVEKTQYAVDLAGKRLAFRVDQTNHDVQVLVIDRETEEIIREIPPDEFLELARKIEEALGLVFDAVA
jgi:flagellar protein FlaG